MLLENPSPGSLHLTHIPLRMDIGKFPQRNNSVSDGFIQELLLQFVVETSQNSFQVLWIIIR